MNIATFDTESAVLDLNNPIALEIGVCVVADTHILFSGAWLIHESFEHLTPEASAYHGITKAHKERAVKQGIWEKDLWRIAGMADAFAFANAEYDIKALASVGIVLPDKPIIDICADERILKEYSEYSDKYKGYKRISVAKLYERVLGRTLEQKHRAESDAVHEAEILVELLKQGVI